MYGERRIVVIAVLLLFLSVIFVYYVYFNSNEDKLSSLKEMFVENKTNEEENITINKYEQTQKTGSVNDKSENLKKDNIENISTVSLMEDEKKFLSGFNNKSNKDIDLLSGTTIWTGEIELLSSLDIDSKNILKGNHNSYFVKIDDEFSEIKENVGKLGGNTVEILTKKNIIKASLTGKKVMYINLPKYKEKLVHMVVKTDDKQWFIQVDYNSYYDGFKNYLRKILNK